MHIATTSLLVLLCAREASGLNNQVPPFYYDRKEKDGSRQAGSWKIPLRQFLQKLSSKQSLLPLHTSVFWGHCLCSSQRIYTALKKSFSYSTLENTTFKGLPQPAKCSHPEVKDQKPLSLLVVVFCYKGQLGQALSLALGISTDFSHLRQISNLLGPSRTKPSIQNCFQLAIHI